MSSNDLALSIRGLSKAYTIVHHTTRHTNLAEALMERIKNPTRRAARETFWALKDIHCDIQKGEVVGIIGRNGAGKSTLLKILSRITEPTTGRIELYGRIGSLLEVGTGFHPELTGRENIYLNGTILGMKRREIDHQFDTIVAFAEVEEFLDTPVKRYSSGMYVRLAFAVAAHLNTEILIVDEVLAVGDAAFQKKCLGKMGDVSREEGRTVLFVSHNMAAVSQLCSRVIWLESGTVKQSGTTAEVTRDYLSAFNSTAQKAQVSFEEDTTKEFQLRSARLLTEDGTTAQHFDCDRPVLLEMHCQAHCQLRGHYGFLAIERADGTRVMMSDSFDTVPNPLEDLSPGSWRLCITIPPRTLAPGDYTVYISFVCPLTTKRDDWIVDRPGTILSFRIEDYTSRRGNKREGFFSTMLPWDIAAEAAGGESEEIFSSGTKPQPEESRIRR